jgi:hypothetical protein
MKDKTITFRRINAFNTNYWTPCVSAGNGTIADNDAIRMIDDSGNPPDTDGWIEPPRVRGWIRYESIGEAVDFLADQGYRVVFEV